MPAAQKIAAEKGIDTSKIQGTGRDGRVTKGDVLAPGFHEPPRRPPALPRRSSKQALQQPPPPINVDELLSGRPEQRVPMSRLRQRVAERLVQSQSTAAILTTFNEVNMAPVMEMRKKYQERFEKEHGARLGFMSFFVKAAVHALKRYPVVNASIDGTDIVYHGYFDIGVAVGSPRGLVVPILRDADRMSFAEIEKKIADFGKRAQDGKLAIEELTGGTFSISNGGVFGSMLSTPIINPPQSAILGVHATKERAVVENGQIVVAADELPRAFLRPSHHRRPRSGPVPGFHKRSARRSGAADPRDMKPAMETQFDVVVIGAGPAATLPRSGPRSWGFPPPASNNGRRPRANTRSAAPASTSAASRRRRCSSPRRTTSACCTSSRRTASPRAGVKFDLRRC